MSRVVVVGDDHVLAALTREVLRREPDHVLVAGDDWRPLPAVNLDDLRDIQIQRPRPLPGDGIVPPAPRFGNRAARRAEASQRRRQR